MRALQLLAVVILVAGAAVGGWLVGRGESIEQAPPIVRQPVEQAVDAGSTAPSGWRAAIEYEDALPEFAEPGPGPRAPSIAAFGLRIGETTVEEARRFAADRGLTCADTSVRALMAARRDRMVTEMERARAAGDVDGATGASWLWRPTRHERNPQVRLTCEAVRLSQLGDRPRDERTLGRLVLVFDSKAHPLRHATIQVRYPDGEHGAARAALVAAEAAMTERLGAPTAQRNAPPTAGEEFVAMQPIRRTWRFADLEAKVSALRLKNGVTVYEEVGVPWPVRADAPVAPTP